MLLTFLPVTYIFPTVSPSVHTVALSLIVEKFSLIVCAVIVYDFTSAMHLIPYPFAFIGSAIDPAVLSEPVNFIFVETPLIVGPIGKCQFSISTLFAIFI